MILTDIAKHFMVCVDKVNTLSNQDFIVAANNKYETFEGDVRDYTDYLYDITDNEDVKSCLDGGVTFGELAEVYYCYKSGYSTKYFSIDGNGINRVESDKEVADLFSEKAEWIINDLVRHPYEEGYADLYKCFINVLIEKKLRKHLVNSKF